MQNNQYIFKLPVLDNYDLNDFILSSSNNYAYNYLINWLSNWGHLPFVNSLLLHGPLSSGKTYLAKIWQQDASAYYFGNNEKYNNDILNKYPAFIIDDIENWDEENLLHHFNVINENKKYLLLTSSCAHYNPKLQDLKSRINSIARIKVEAPNHDLMKIFLFKLFSQVSVKAPSQFQEYLIPRLPRDFNKITDFVIRINEFALSKKRSLSIPLAKEYLAISKILD